ncbi:MAG: hypothetical protein JWR32_891 [Mycobacterium sp.]|jgi:hypothetical protein|nr:hypothetical protein [Mycobacterium sp.]
MPSLLAGLGVPGVLIVSVGTGVCMALGAHNQWSRMPQRIRRFIPSRIGRRYARTAQAGQRGNRCPAQ